VKIVYQLLLSGGASNPHFHLRWSCPDCAYLVDQCEDDPSPEAARAIAQKKADAHECDYGWCPVPITDERLILAAISPYHFDFVVSAADRERWNDLRRRNKERTYA
jgi:hypothetical protein